MSLQRLHISMIHVLKQLRGLEKITAWKMSVYFVVPLSFSTFSIALQAEKSSS